MKNTRSLLLGVVLLLGSFAATDRVALAEGGGVAATAHPLATEAAIQMLEIGGNAVDAAVSAAFTIGVVEPDGSGLGGGGGILLYLHGSGETHYINYYHQAPADPGAISFNTGRDRNTAKSVLVPGTVAGLCETLEKYGSLPLPVVIEPAIRYARDGFRIDATLAGLILDSMESLAESPELSEVFLTDGFPKMEGDLMVQSRLAEVLQRVSDHGRDGFYRGATAEALVEGLTAQGGAMTLEDLAAFEPMTTEPVYGRYRDLDIVSASPPHSGVTLIEIMNMMELLEFSSGEHFTDSASTLHMMSEIFRRAYADRSQYLGDPRFVRTPVTGLMAKGYAREIFNQINPYRAEPRNYRDTPYGKPLKFDGAPQDGAGSPLESKKNLTWEDDNETDPGLLGRTRPDPFDRWNKRGGSGDDDEVNKGEKSDSKNFDDDDFDDDDGFDGGHTTHLSVIDGDGNMVALTQTLGNFFGSKVMINGILLNNGRINFSANSKANLIGPNKRPRSSLTPTLVFRDGKPFMSLGSPGAGRIIATVAQILVNVTDFSMDVQAANDAPRIFCQKFDDHLSVEARVPEEVVAQLGKMGHSVRVLADFDLFFGGVQMTAIDPVTGALVGSADPRRGGSAITLQPVSAAGE